MAQFLVRDVRFIDGKDEEKAIIGQVTDDGKVRVIARQVVRITLCEDDQPVEAGITHFEMIQKEHVHS